MRFRIYADRMKRFSISALIFAMILTITPIHAQEVRDTDGDDIPDIEEDLNDNCILDDSETDPFNADTDVGGESDGSEKRAGRNPRDPTDDMSFDSDGDGWVNALELLRGTDPENPDSDNDGTPDSTDPFPLDPKFSKDENRNGLPDEWEIHTNLDTKSDQTTGSDPDGDGLTNEEELKEGTDPLAKDTDGDGIDDDKELEKGTDPKENACLTFGGIETAFADATNHWSKEYVSRLQRTRVAPDQLTIIQGYDIDDEKLFLPDRDVTRFEFLKMVLFSSCAPLIDNTIDVDVRFTDVPSIPQLNEATDVSMRRRIIYTAVERGIVEGYEDGTFRPDAVINRAEALKILVGASHLEPPVDATNLARIFPDVKEDDWFRPYVSAAAWFEIIGGYEDGELKPGNNLTRGQAAKMIYLAMTVNPTVNGYIFPPL